MGGSSNNPAPEQTPAPTGLGGGIQGFTTTPPFAPGMDQMLAQQLAQGGYGGGNMQDILSYFQKIYSPIKTPTYNKDTGGTMPGITPLPKGEGTTKKAAGNELLDAESGRPIGEAKGFRIEGNTLVKIPRR